MFVNICMIAALQRFVLCMFAEHDNKIEWNESFECWQNCTGFTVQRGFCTTFSFSVDSHIPHGTRVVNGEIFMMTAG